MRRLLLILFCLLAVSQTWGQNLILVPDDSLIGHWVTFLTDASLPQFWDSYKAECWADSIVPIFLDSVEIHVWRGDRPDTSYWRKQYTEIKHRPATFEGFIEYLRGKK